MSGSVSQEASFEDTLPAERKSEIVSEMPFDPGLWGGPAISSLASSFRADITPAMSNEQQHFSQDQWGTEAREAAYDAQYTCLSDDQPIMASSDTAADTNTAVLAWAQMERDIAESSMMQYQDTEPSTSSPTLARAPKVRQARAYTLGERSASANDGKPSSSKRLSLSMAYSLSSRGTGKHSHSRKSGRSHGSPTTVARHESAPNVLTSKERTCFTAPQSTTATPTSSPLPEAPMHCDTESDAMMDAALETVCAWAASWTPLPEAASEGAERGDLGLAHTRRNAIGSDVDLSRTWSPLSFAMPRSSSALAAGYVSPHSQLAPPGAGWGRARSTPALNFDSLHIESDDFLDMYTSGPDAGMPPQPRALGSYSDAPSDAMSAPSMLRAASVGSVELPSIPPALVVTSHYDATSSTETDDEAQAEAQAQARSTRPFRAPLTRVSKSVPSSGTDSSSSHNLSSSASVSLSDLSAYGSSGGWVTTDFSSATSVMSAGSSVTSSAASLHSHDDGSGSARSEASYPTMEALGNSPVVARLSGARPKKAPATSPKSKAPATSSKSKAAGPPALVVCPECGFSCSNRSNMSRHRRRHGTERPYKCGVCGRGFINSTNRRRHEVRCARSSTSVPAGVSGNAGDAGSPGPIRHTTKRVPKRE